MSHKEGKDSHQTKEKSPNALIHQSSPYLLQHAYNPVQWYPWGEEALRKAREEDKPILVSIGYSACHWCHVMEKESFENEEIAAIMNEHFINIKVDREERPDIDQIYMEAVQTMNVSGGWPLNVFLTPDAKPFYGGTYFPPAHWAHLLKQISNAFKNHRTELEHSALEFTRALNFSDTEKYGLTDTEATFSKGEVEAFFPSLEKRFDKKLGGMDKAPKFPMPSVYRFLLRHYHLTKNTAALDHVRLSLNKMARGGIYDQAGGGFARYSTDKEWFAPHFEKMLYDNAQLVSVYSEAWLLENNQEWKEVVYETVAWLKTEMTGAEGGFYSALDADSEGEEGKFYVWTKKEIEEIFSDEEAALIKDYYNIRSGGSWEKGVNILFRDMPDDAFARKHKMDIETLESKVKSWKKTLLEKRAVRIRPGLDDKILASWNGMMLKGLADAYRAFDEDEFLELARKNAEFISEKMRRENKLFHSYKNGKATVDGFLEDYAFVIEGFIALYEASFEERWIYEAKELCDYAIEHFYDKKENLFYFTSGSGELIARKKEIFDNVIPASNSVMAENLYRLGKLFYDDQYSDLSLQMLARVKKLIKTDPSYMSNWACLYSLCVQPTAEIAIIGKDYLLFRKSLGREFNPNKIIAGTAENSNVPMLKDRYPREGNTTIYVCYNKTCKLPVISVTEALKLMK